MAQYEMNLHDYVRILRRRKLIVILMCLIATAGSIMYSRRQTDMFEAKVVIKVEQQSTIAGLLTEWVVYRPGDVMATAANFIKSTPVLKRVALELNMLKLDATPEQISDVVTDLRSRIKVETIRDSNIIELIVSSLDAVQTRDLANKVAESFIAEDLIDKTKQARNMRLFLEEQLTRIETKLKEEEEKLKSGTSVNVHISPNIQNELADLEFELRALQQKYTDKHPKIAQIKEQIADLEGMLQGFSVEELEYIRLQREIEANKKLYITLNEKIEDARMNEVRSTSDITILEPAVLPKKPINRQKQGVPLIGAVLGLIAGIILAFIKDSMDTSIGTIEDVEAATKLRVLGVIPTVKINRKKPELLRLIVHRQPDATVSEAYRAIRTNLKLTPAIRTIMVTCANPKEGKTTLLTNLGLTLAQAGIKTLLVSSDLRRPSLAKSFGMNESNGFIEILNGTVPFEKAVRNISDIMLGEMSLDEALKTPGLENIYILPSGHSSMSPAELLTPKSIQALIEQMKKQFDIILFDSPPTLPVTDASIMAPCMDVVIVVYEAGRTSRDALMRCKMQLETAGARISGIVLNNAKPNTEPLSAYSYYYYHRHESPSRG